MMTSGKIEKKGEENIMHNLPAEYCTLKENERERRRRIEGRTVVRRKQSKYHFEKEG